MCLAIPGEILSIEGDDALTRSGRVSFGGVVKVVSLGLLPDAHVGQYVLVHAGVAINQIDEAEAGKVFELLDELGLPGDLEDARA